MKYRPMQRIVFRRRRFDPGTLKFELQTCSFVYFSTSIIMGSAAMPIEGIGPTTSITMLSTR